MTGRNPRAGMCRATAALAGASLTMLAGCATPPPSAFLHGEGQASVVAIPVGTNSAGEPCTQDAASPASHAAISCGTWVQPSANLRRIAGPASAAAAANDPAWRAELDRSLSCGAPEPATILGRLPAQLLSCTARQGGWPYVAVAAEAGGAVWVAQGVRPALPAIERGIGVLSGAVKPDEAGSQAVSAGLAAQRLAAQAFSAGDISQYQNLIRAANRANLAGNFASAETALRAAVALQERVQGPSSPALARPLASLALQISNQGRFSEAERVLNRADTLAHAPDQTDPIALPQFIHYRALCAFNQGKRDTALAGLRAAEAQYADLLPPEALIARAQGARRSLEDSLGNQSLLKDNVERAAIYGVLETRRAEARMLRLAGDTQQSSRVLESAAALAQARDITEPKLAAYLNRSSAVVADALGQQSEGLERLSTSAAMFAHAAPGSRAYAETGLLWAANQARAGQVDAALASCREAINVLRAAQAGTSAALLQPCLDLLAHQAAQESGGGQTLLAEMFAASQLAQSSLTTEQISQASARLQENARNPEVARLIRARDDARTRLSDLYESRDDLRAGPRGPRFNDQDDALSKRIAALQVEQGKLDSELQAASPNFGQLVQQVVDAKDVFAALQPGEAFAAISLTTDHGFIFLLRDGRITAATIDGGTPVFEALVKRVRASLDNVPSPPPPFDTAAAAEIYRRVLGGVAGALQGANALTVAPAGPLLSVPFDLLLTGPADPANLRAAPWLMQQMAVAHVPAAVNFVSLRRIAGTSKATRPWFGFGGFIAPTAAQARATFPVATCADTADLLTELDPLQNAKSELAAVRQLLGASTGDQLLGRDFTLAAVKSAQLKHYRLLHFATHAFLPTELRCQNEPALVASTVPDAANMAQALLPASQLAELDLDADAVILSACNTAGPGGSGGESLSGLARSFFFAGARALLVTHWEVNDRFAAYEVALTIRNFHDTPGLGLARALAQAQHQVIDEARGDLAGQAHPFYWAAFAVIGDGIGKGNTRVSGL